MRWRARSSEDHGAAAVEMAIVLPILVLLLGGIVDLGFAFNAQISLTHAAREGVRVEAIGTGDGAAAAQAAFVALGTGPATATVTRSCPNANGAQVRVSATYDAIFIPLFSRTLNSQAVMRCNG